MADPRGLPRLSDTLSVLTARGCFFKKLFAKRNGAAGLPVVAVALLLDFPIWTEDQDFFGSSVATGTTDRVELYLRES